VDWGIIWKYTPLLLDGLKVTLWLWPAGVALALLLGAVLVAAGRSNSRLLVAATRVYTEIILGIPILVLLYVVYFVLPKFGLRLPELAAGLLTLMLYYSPYMAEVIRGALNAIPMGQVEAAQTIGMSAWQIARRITVPQALGLAIPPLTGICIGLAKDTAILSLVSVPEFAYQTKQVVSRTYAPFETWFVVVICYYVILSLFEQAMRLVERRVTAYRGTADRFVSRAVR
jgi:polar amino acid transport system permease protein